MLLTFWHRRVVRLPCRRHPENLTLGDVNDVHRTRAAGRATQTRYSKSGSDQSQVEV